MLTIVTLLAMDSQTTTSSTCTCSQPGERGRNLVVCIDGTSNRFGAKSTNVVTLYSKLLKDDTQLTYYNSGIGTYANTSRKSFKYWLQILQSVIDMVFAWNVDEIILDAYRWLAQNYQEGDVVYLFGFSRGAYQIRALAGMIEKTGIIHKDNKAQIPFAYELYASQGDIFEKKTAHKIIDIVCKIVLLLLALPFLFLRPPSDPLFWLAGIFVPICLLVFFQFSFLPGLILFDRRRKPSLYSSEDVAREFKKAFCHSKVHVHFVGCWDTVSSIGFFRRKTLPLADSMRHVCFFRHALALDERRVKFMPEYLVFSQPLTNPPSSLQSQHPDHVKEVWFPGVHLDVGGRNLVIDGRAGNPSLRWMAQQAHSRGLRGDFHWPRDLDVPVGESLGLAWRCVEFLPMKRLTYKDRHSITYWPNMCYGRVMQSGQAIHSSVAFAKSDYIPRAQLPPNLSWEMLPGRRSKLVPESPSWAVEFDVDDHPSGSSFPGYSVGAQGENMLCDLMKLWAEFHDRNSRLEKEIEG